MSTENVILSVGERADTYKEGYASGSVYPGMLLEQTSSVDTFKAHSKDSGAGERLFADINFLYGKDKDDAYSSGDRLYIVSARRGDVVNARVTDGQDIAIGDYLCSNGDGNLKKLTPSSSGLVTEEGYLIGTAQEAINTESSSGADSHVHCKIRIW
jgi:hypothetical protein